MLSYGEWIAVGQSCLKPAQIIQPFEKQSTTELVVQLVQAAARLSQTPLEPPVNLQIHVSGTHMGDMCTKPTGPLRRHKSYLCDDSQMIIDAYCHGSR